MKDPRLRIFSPTPLASDISNKDLRVSSQLMIAGKDGNKITIEKLKLPNLKHK